MMGDGVLLLAHGSRRAAANQEIIDIGELVKARDPQGLYQVAFMQFGNPDIGHGLDELVKAGSRRIIVMPVFLVTGNHITQDIPEEFQRLQERYHGVEFVMAQHLAGHPGLVDIILDRVQAGSKG